MCKITEYKFVSFSGRLCNSIIFICVCLVCSNICVSLDTGVRAQLSWKSLLFFNYFLKSKNFFLFLTNFNFQIANYSFCIIKFEFFDLFSFKISTNFINNFSCSSKKSYFWELIRKHFHRNFSLLKNYNKHRTNISGM